MNDLEYQTMSDVESLHWWFSHRYKKVRRVLADEAILKNHALSIFDVGCGTGGLLLRLRDEKFISTVNGCEPNPLGNKYCKSKGLSIINSEIESISNLEDSYDAILCMDVFYHKDVDPIKAMHAICKLLKPGGVLIVNVAAMPCLRNSHDIREMGARRLLLKELSRLALSSGFHIKDIYYWNSWLSPAIWFKSRVDGFRKSVDMSNSSLSMPPRLINRLLKSLLSLEEKASCLYRLPFGTSLFLVASKIDNRI